MKKREITDIIIAFVVLTIVIIIEPIINSNQYLILQAPFIAIVILTITILSKRIFAYFIETDVEHELWRVQRFGFKTHRHLKKPAPLGAILPLFLTLITLGSFKCTTLLTYEAKALKTRAAKRHGHYSFAELTDRHNALIGAVGVVSLLALSMVAYLVNLEYLTKIAIYYAFFSMLPIAKLDGAQIFFGNRTLYAVLGIITLLFTAFAILI